MFKLCLKLNNPDRTYYLILKTWFLNSVLNISHTAIKFGIQNSLQYVTGKDFVLFYYLLFHITYCKLYQQINKMQNRMCIYPIQNAYIRHGTHFNRGETSSHELVKDHWHEAGSSSMIIPYFCCIHSCTSNSNISENNIVNVEKEKILVYYYRTLNHITILFPQFCSVISVNV